MSRAKPESTLDSFEVAVRTLMHNVNLFEDGPPHPHPAWFDNKGNAKTGNIQKAILSGRKCLPLHYQESYVNPLLENLYSITEQVTKPQLKALAGAVYAHGVLNHPKDKKIQDEFHFSLKCLLAMISNTYRSFLGEERFKKNNIPIPTHNIPPLAAFYSPKVGDRMVAPFILSKSNVRKWTGGSVGIISFPSAYRKHPMLWAAIAHEVGGHELLAFQPNLLSELQNGVRSLFFPGPVTRGIDIDRLNKKEKFGLIWQYWTEEATSDVCGVLNVGPSYGIGLAVYQAALNAFIQLEIQMNNGVINKIDKTAITNFFKKKREEPNENNSPDKPFLRLWTTLHPRLVDFLEPGDSLPDLDAHPIDILKLHVIIGAINGLNHLPNQIKNNYTNQLRKTAKVCSAGQSRVFINGNIQVDKETWITIREKFNLEEMEVAAEKVGYFIATATLQAFGGKSLQDIETWDQSHEDKVNEITKTLVEAEYKGEDSLFPNIENLGDDAQLIAGVTLAFYKEPEKYKFFNDSLELGLYTSYQRDQFWGEPVFHGTYDWTSDKKSKLEEILEKRKKSKNA